MAIQNHLLFSEIFFQQIRRETEDLDNLRATLGTIRNTWQYYLSPPADWASPGWKPSASFSGDDVSQLRSNVVEPIFGYLNLTYGPCEADARAFLLYSDWARQDATGLCTVLPYSQHIAGRDPDTGIIPKGRNYAQQLIRLLREHELDWGVLTNGRHWRLFHRTELSPTETYLHVDLERIILEDDITSYIVFHRFFSRPAFVREEGQQRLDLYKQQSDEATEVIEEHLSAHVEEIARQLCQGLVESCREAGQDVTGAGLRSKIYKNALFLIYRLLFVLYAEARDLLPLDVSTYRDVCLRDLLDEVRDNHRHGLRYADEYAMWRRLEALFALIDQGDPNTGVPAYNGGLFDPGRRPFLTEHRIRNSYLQAALIRLSTVPAKGKSYDQDREPQPIDYRDLSVRHLGSLYEGLLEYNLFVVEDEPRVVRATTRKTRYIPYSEAGKVRASEMVLGVGQVYFSETEGERKATGSYYTPEDVVDYIVRNTVGEKLAELKAEFYASHEIERQLEDLNNTPADIPAHRQIQRALDDQFLQFVEQEVLDLKILDPAMGSGHFLVNATHAVANFIVEFLNETPGENPEIDADVVTWKREVGERCVFGVDVNELAVELGKLCLWMTTAAKGKPLTFLDHHVSWGDSLIGAWVQDLGFHPRSRQESKEAFTIPLEHFQPHVDRVLAKYQELYAKSGDDVVEVRQKARIFDEEIATELEPFRRLLDLHTTIYWDNNVKEETYAEIGNAVNTPSGWTETKTQIQDLLSGYGHIRWFHWELEFPEVFFVNDKGHAGFDIVIGNPPYASYPDPFSDTFLNSYYESVGSGDMYALFLERAVQISDNASSRLGFIVPLSLTFSSRLSSLREVLESESRSWRIYSFDKRPQAIFPDVQQRTSIIIGGPSSDSAQIMSGPLLRWRPDERRALFHDLEAYDCTDLTLEVGIPKLGSVTQGRALRQLLSLGGSVSDHLTRDTDAMSRQEEELATVYFFGVAYRWLVAAKALPPTVSPDGQPVHLSGFSSLQFQDEKTAWMYMAILDSLIAFWFWLVYGDSFHVTKTLLGSLPVDVDLLSDCAQRHLVDLGRELQKEMFNHIFYNKMRGRITANYDLLACRHITDKVDRLLVEEFNLGEDFLADIRHFCAAAAGQL